MDAKLPPDRARAARDIAARRLLRAAGAVRAHLAQVEQVSPRLVDELLDADELDGWMALAHELAHELLLSIDSLGVERTRAAEAAALAEARRKEPAAGA